METPQESDEPRGRSTGERPRARGGAAQAGGEDAGDEPRFWEVEEGAPGAGCPIALRRMGRSALRRPEERRLRRSWPGGSGSTWPDKVSLTGTPWRNPA